MAERKSAGSLLRHNSHISDFEPGDGQAGDWPRERLVEMDQRFRERLERAFRQRLESRAAAASKELTGGDPNAQAVLVLADVRLDVIDAVLTYATMRGNADEIGGWKNTFADAFRASPVLCQRLSDTYSNYGLIVPIGRAACRSR